MYIVAIERPRICSGARSMTQAITAGEEMPKDSPVNAANAKNDV